MSERPRRGPDPAPAAAPQRAPNPRRALSHVGGQTSLAGDPEAARALAAALDVPTSEQAEDAARAHVHGFHAYPARMHPMTARRLIESFSEAGEAVLDPFCGSGTVVVEARLCARRALGIDANPLAVRLAELKARGASDVAREKLVLGATRVATVADERRKAKSGPSHRYGSEDVELFEPHVLLELDGLRLGLDALDDSTVRSDLELVFSAILTKVSRRTSDTSDRALPRRIAAGYPARLFVKKTEELTERLAEIAPVLAEAPAALIREGDARELVGVRPGSVALIVTSPPYPGVYDYLAHHAARLRWLKLNAQSFDEAEVGRAVASIPSELARVESDGGTRFAASSPQWRRCSYRTDARFSSSPTASSQEGLSTRTISSSPWLLASGSR